jgi:cell division protein FtsI/penicillin-binding protein 2
MRRFQKIRSREVTRPPVKDSGGWRLLVLRFIFAAAFLAVAGRFFVLQVVSHEYYAALAADQHTLLAKFFPKRGSIYLADSQTPDNLFPAAVNRPSAVVYANPQEIEDPVTAARAVAPLLGLDETLVLAKLDRRDDPYEILKRRAGDDEVAAVKTLGIRGVYFASESVRFYPEAADLSQITGFVGENETGERVGRYGLESRWQDQLAGRQGLLIAEQDPLGGLIGSAERSFEPAQDGADLVLTVDRAIQHVVCQKLREAVKRHRADGGSVVVLDPKTGAVMAMCSDPAFDANDYAVTADLGTFNNPAIFAPYEPGSVFKPVTMAGAIDAGRASPTSTFDDSGAVVIGSHAIHNSDGKAHGVVTMNEVLEQSLNTGTVFVARQLGKERFREYVSAFGFGEKTGLDTASEAPGDVSSLKKAGEIYMATGSFGQGITATPLQMAVAYGAIANGGRLMQPYLVAEVRDGDMVERTEPKFVRQAVGKRAANLVASMLVNVVENGHGKPAKVPGYWVAGKTGTAQIPGVGGYEADAFIGSFVGFAPVDDPVFVMAVKIIRPRDVEWAESSAAPLFGDIASYLLKYLQVPPTRT